MIHDAVVVGIGTAGLTAALRLAEQGRRVLVVAKGIGSTHLAAGTIDVLGYNPEPVPAPAEALPRFLAGHPEHPYARLGEGVLHRSLEWLRERLADLRYVGGLEENLLLPTAVGVAKPTALAPESMAGGDLVDESPLVVVGFRQLKDFFPAYLAENLRAAGVSARGLELVPPTDGQADVGQLGFARRFEDAEFRKAVTRELERELRPGERVGFPAVLGLERSREVWLELQDALDAPVFEVPTIPPSVPGMRLFAVLRAALRRAGGTMILNAPVVGTRADGPRLRAVVTGSAGRPTPHEAASFVLASGGFSSGALELTSSGELRETVLGLPVPPPTEGPRFLPRYFDRHPLNRVGLAVDDRLRPVDLGGGAVYENVHAAGAVLGGAEPWKEKSGEGISVATGYAAASAILEG